RLILREGGGFARLPRLGGRFDRRRCLRLLRKDRGQTTQRAVAAGGTTALPAAGTTGPIPAAGGSATSAAATGPKAPTAGGRVEAEPAARTDVDTRAESNGRAEPAADSNPAEAPEVLTATTESAEPEAKNAVEDAKAGNGKAAAKPARTKRGKAPMPSWEDVLLGVRSSGH
ncbi:septation protein SepH, partial [Nocardia cyriacigeorgica]|uniref:septation protein SepH n=1 Tax=Nocardia cyriacigeorgica TaxID=135487 RepID=UPI0021141BA5